MNVMLAAGSLKCSICLNTWHDVVTVTPCFHNFCNGCFSEWMRRSEVKHSIVFCPQCRAEVCFVGRNHFLRDLEKLVLHADSSLERSAEEIALLDSYATVSSNMAIRDRKRRRKRADMDLDEETNSVAQPCPQCGNGLNGFQCNDSTTHLQCHTCGGLFPSRTDVSVPYYCVGCDRVFCGAYWNSQNIAVSTQHAVCGPETFKPVSDHVICRIPFGAHEGNQYEQHVTDMCIHHNGETLEQVVTDWIYKLDNREMDLSRMPLIHADSVNSRAHVCRDCFDKLVSFLLYWYRVSLTEGLLPPDIARREDCWYGYACRTQHHNEEHARKRNHVCRPRRGNM